MVFEVFWFVSTLILPTGAHSKNKASFYSGMYRSFPSNVFHLSAILSFSKDSTLVTHYNILICLFFPFFEDFF
ncbi:hypothetical protein HanRHA438_Chr11g0511581 [Helianthus annuus]|nr:hypothetical protein HanIR_Chr11g0537161 [Helianthus annuus]KAJ0871373.1 hypothetical protein HanRHA438_Chr11g0511581 [Helianthus annuus]